jgi:hypothetical protein
MSFKVKITIVATLSLALTFLGVAITYFVAEKPGIALPYMVSSFCWFWTTAFIYLKNRDEENEAVHLAVMQELVNSPLPVPPQGGSGTMPNTGAWAYRCGAKGGHVCNHFSTNGYCQLEQPCSLTDFPSPIKITQIKATDEDKMTDNIMDNIAENMLNKEETT